MSLTPLSQKTLHQFQSVRLLATDMDGTLTNQGKFTAEVLHTLVELAEANFPVVIVTGRSAGWVSGLVHYLPIAGAIAENGGIFFPRHTAPEIPLVPISDFAAHRQHLAQMFQVLQTEFPNLQESTDNRYRLTDWTFDVQGLSQTEIETLARRCLEAGWGFTYSTVQCHISLPQQNKAAGLQTVLKDYFPGVTTDAIATVGDSPNDESLFNPDLFPLSVGVANVLDYRDRLTHLPAFVTTQSEGKGFCEFSSWLLQALNTQPMSMI